MLRAVPGCRKIPYMFDGPAAINVALGGGGLPASGAQMWDRLWDRMARQRNKLTAVGIKNAADGKHNDGGGLMLNKAGSAGRWIYRYMFAGARRDMGLGAWPAVSLADARKARDKWMSVIAEGRDPIAERTRLIEAERAELDKTDPTLADVTQQVFEAKKAALRGEGERGRWLSPLSTHVLPKIGGRRISSLHQADIRDCLTPIWKAKPATAEKAIQRLGIIFRQAKLSGLDVDPFTIEAARHMLGEVNRKPTPTPATPWQDIPALFERLGAKPTSSHLCLQWMILTAVRSDGCRGARLSEIQEGVWTVPADRVKGREGKVDDFRVPLSPAAAEIAEQCRVFQSDGVMFPGHRGKPLSSTAIEKAMNELGEVGRPHGLRTSFRTWVQDTEAATFDVAETALGHIIGGKVERAYARSDLLEPRRALMEKWARFVTGGSAQVISLPRQGRASLP